MREIEAGWLEKAWEMDHEDLEEEANALAASYAESETLRVAYPIIGFVGSIPFSAIVVLVLLFFIPPNMAPVLALGVPLSAIIWMGSWDVAYKIHERKVERKWGIR